MASQHLTPAHSHPPLGSQVAITTPGAAAHYLALVNSHLGRYFYAGGHRFHVSDDWSPTPDHRCWRTAAAMARLLSSEECPAAAAVEGHSSPPAQDPWLPPPEPVGPCEPTEAW
jgi:hypothetical protein